MSLGIFLWYYTLIGLNIRHYSIISNAANYQPLTILVHRCSFSSSMDGAPLPSSNQHYDREWCLSDFESFVGNDTKTSDLVGDDVCWK
jgi:hypothetical protein